MNVKSQAFAKPLQVVFRRTSNNQYRQKSLNGYILLENGKIVKDKTTGGATVVKFTARLECIA